MNVRRVIAALAIFAVVATGIGVSIAVLTANKAPPVAETTQPPLPPKAPTPAELQIGVIVTEQNCTATARVYKYRVEPKYVGRHPLPDKEIKVVYQVTGWHQPQLGDFTIQNGQARALQDVPLEGPPGARLQASVTQIVG
jgi:hypothetical protein